MATKDAKGAKGLAGGCDTVRARWMDGALGSGGVASLTSGCWLASLRDGLGGADGDACAARVGSTDESELRLSTGPGACRQANGWSCEWVAKHWVVPGGSDVPGENVEEPVFGKSAGSPTTVTA